MRFSAGFQEPGGMFADFDMVGIRVHSNLATSVHEFVRDPIPLGICLVPLHDYQSCSCVASHHFSSIGLCHLGRDGDSPL